MPHLELNKVTFAYTENVIIKDADWRIDESSRYGFIGRNGVGKTTLFRLMVGELTPESGTITRSKNLSLGYLRQGEELHVEKNLFETMLDPFRHFLKMKEEMRELEQKMSGGDNSRSTLAKYGSLQDQYKMEGGYVYEEKIRSVLQGVGFSREDMTRRIVTFSGGEKNRAALARVLLSEPDILILDEPTNHLDIQGTEWLEDYLDSFRGGLVVVAHDRFFIDKVTRKIVELERKKLTFYTGNYSAYREQKTAELERERKRYAAQRQYVEKTEDFIRRNIAGQKTRQAQSRRKKLKKMEYLENPYEDASRIKLNFAVKKPGSNLVLYSSNLSKTYDSKKIFEQANLKLYRGSKVGLIGPNGSGKSTFLKLVLNEQQPSSGKVELGDRISIGYYDQHLQDVNESNTVFDEIRELDPKLTDGEIRGYLARFLFSSEDVFKPVSLLSGGERARVSLAKLMKKKANLLLLDEPTNHLDIAGRESLEEALKEYNGSMIFVTHDRYLLNSVVDRIWALQNGTIEEFLGTYSDYHDKMMRLNEEAEEQKQEVEELGRRRTSKKELRKKRAEQRKKIGVSPAVLEREIFDLEQRVNEINESFFDPALSSDWEKLEELQKEKNELQDKIDRLLEQWEKACEQFKEYD